MTYNVYKEAKALATEAWEESVLQFGSDCDIDELRESADQFLHESCNSHEIAIYTYKAIQFCADVDTSDGEACLDDWGGISRDGDTFGQIACRIAFATLYVAGQELLQELSDAFETERDNTEEGV